MSNLLDYSVISIGVVSLSYMFYRFKFLKFGSTNTDAVHEAYFNIMWSKK